MMKNKHLLLILLILIVQMHYGHQKHYLQAQENFNIDRTFQPGNTNLQSDLALNQSRIAEQYSKLEKIMMRVAEFESEANPHLSDLLRQGVARSKDGFVLSRMQNLISLLNRQSYKDAIDGQEEVRMELKAILELLQSEDRAPKLRDMQARFREYIKELERISRKQRSLQARTENGTDAKKLAKEQKQVAERTDSLSQQIQENEEIPQNENSPSSEIKPKDIQSGKQKKRQSEDGKQNDGNPPSENNDAQEKSQSGNPSDNQSQQDQGENNPAQKRIQQAEQKMRQAQKNLEEAKRDEALEKQEEAKSELAKAIAELEEILRQLREEEIERMLIKLESRFQKMLEMQMKVYEETVELDIRQKQSQDATIVARSGKLRSEQLKIVREADKALTLLSDEGSSLAFPETVRQIKSEMLQVVDRLGSVKLGSVTQTFEKNIIEALEEALLALEKAQEEQEKRRNSPQQQSSSSQGNPEDQPLVDSIAELKMIRMMQMRVNKSTRQFSKYLSDEENTSGQATDKELIEILINISKRQEKIRQITRDIVLGKNQ